jgi:formylglycine-generating enzyme required for sulfatase activity
MAKKFFFLLALFAAFLASECAEFGDETVSSIASHVMVLIPPGTFLMGSSETEPGRNTDETQYSVTLTHGFYMGKYPVTQELYRAVMGSNPSWFTNFSAAGEVQTRRPAENVSWYSALVFCNKLSALEGLIPVYSIRGSTNPADWGPVPVFYDDSAWDAVIMNSGANGYRLPTEAEWEYACRAGTTTAHNLGDTWSDDWGWFRSNSGDMTHEIGKKTANAWELYDMHGNVLEYCWDWYGAYAAGTVSDPTGPDRPGAESLRVVRSGSWYAPARLLRSACRDNWGQSFGGFDIGFRVVRADF